MSDRENRVYGDTDGKNCPQHILLLFIAKPLADSLEFIHILQKVISTYFIQKLTDTCSRFD